jgi:hypothetical protein
MRIIKLSVLLALMGSALWAQPNTVVRELGCIASGSGTAQACSIPFAPSAYAQYVKYWFVSSAANTAAMTINFNGLGAKTIKKVQGGITTDLVANDIQANQYVLLAYDGTNMQMLSELGNAASGGGSMTWPSGAGIAVYSGSSTWSAAATYPTIVGLWAGGSCVGYLKNDGTCSTSTTNLLSTANTWLARQTFTPSASNAMLNVGSYAGVPASGTVGDLWYNSSSGALNAQVGAGTFALAVIAAQTWTAKQTFPITSSVAGINLGTGSSDPSPLVNGDIWLSGSTIKYQAGGATYSLGTSTGVTGSGTSGSLAKWTGSSSIGNATINSDYFGPSADAFWTEATAKVGIGTNTQAMTLGGFTTSSTIVGAFDAFYGNSNGSPSSYTKAGGRAFDIDNGASTNPYFAWLYNTASNQYQLLSLSSAGTMLLNNQTPSSGVTSLIIKEGAGQSSNAPFVLESSAGAVLSYFDQNGNIQLPNQNTNTVMAAPNGLSGVPGFRSLVAADIPALGYAPTIAGTSGYFPTVNGSGGWSTYFAPQGTGDTKVLLAGTVASSSGQALCTDGNYGATTTGCTSSGMTNPMTTLGDTIYENSSPAAARLAGNTSTSQAVLTQTGTGSASAAPVWRTTPTFNGSGLTGMAGTQISFTPSGSGAVATTVSAKNQQTVSVIDFGADPTGTNDSTAAIQAAINAVAASSLYTSPRLTSGTVIVPRGTYTVSEQTTTISDVGTGAGTSGKATIQLKDGVEMDCYGAVIQTSSTLTDSMVKAYSRDDNVAGNFVKVKMNGCNLILNSSAVPILDTTGMRSSQFEYMDIWAPNVSGSIGINITDRSFKNSSWAKSSFDNSYDSITGGGVDTAIKWVATDGNVGFQNFTNFFGFNANVAVFDTTGNASNQTGSADNCYFYGASNAVMYKNAVPQTFTTRNTFCESCVANGIEAAAFGGLTATPEFLVYAYGELGDWRQSRPTAYIDGGLLLGPYGFLGVDGGSPLTASDLSSAGWVVSGCAISGSGSNYQMGACSAYNGYRLENSNNIYTVATATSGLGTHTEIVYVDNSTLSGGQLDRIHATTGSLPAGGLALAIASVNNSGVIGTITDLRVYTPTFTINASTASALAAAPTTCSTGYAPTGITANGNATGCASLTSSGMSNPMTTLGDIIYENATPAPARLAGNTTTTPEFLVETGNGSAAAAPGWLSLASALGSQTANCFWAAPNGSPGNFSCRAIVAADVPTLNQTTTGTAGGLTGGAAGSIPIQTGAGTTGFVAGNATGSTDAALISTSSGSAYSTTSLKNAPALSVANMTGGLPTATTGHQVVTPLVCVSSTASPSSVAYGCNTTPSFSPAAGDTIVWQPGSNDTANTGSTLVGSGTAPTLAINGGTAYNIVEGPQQAGIPIGRVGKTTTGAQFILTFDGTNWETAFPQSKHAIVFPFYNPSNLAATITSYYTVPFSCTVSHWNTQIVGSSQTATFDVLRIATGGTALPTSSIVGSGTKPNIASGNAAGPTVPSSWTSVSLAANDIIAGSLTAVSLAATYAVLTLECDE